MEIAYPKQIGLDRNDLKGLGRQRALYKLPGEAGYAHLRELQDAAKGLILALDLQQLVREL